MTLLPSRLWNQRYSSSLRDIVIDFDVLCKSKWKIAFSYDFPRVFWYSSPLKLTKNFSLLTLLIMIAAILLGIWIFMFLVLIHEFGHFSTARRFKVKVHEFGIGIPPKVLTLLKDKKWTAFTINWIPLWGFVRLKGEDPSDENEFLAEDSFITASLIGKIIILVAGITVNLLFARLAFTIAFRQGVQPISILPDSATRTTSSSYLMPSYSFLVEKWFIAAGLSGAQTPIIVKTVIPDSRTAKLTLQSGDRVIGIDAIPVFQENIWEILRNKFGTSFDLAYERNGIVSTHTIICWEDECILGIVMENQWTTSKYMPLIKFPFRQAAQAGREEIRAETKLTFTALWSLGKSLISFDQKRISGSVNKLSWPVGIVKMIETVFAQGGRRQLLAFAWIISLALALFNILPIPALDWWRALSVIIQAIGWRKPTTYFVIENRLNTFFFIVLMLLGVRIILKDLVVFWDVSIPFMG